MREMGWSWRELMETPFDLVQEIVIRLGAETHWREQKRQMDSEARNAGEYNV